MGTQLFESTPDCRRKLTAQYEFNLCNVRVVPLERCVVLADRVFVLVACHLVQAYTFILSSPMHPMHGLRLGV